MQLKQKIILTNNTLAEFEVILIKLQKIESKQAKSQYFKLYFNLSRYQKIINIRRIEKQALRKFMHLPNFNKARKKLQINPKQKQSNSVHSPINQAQLEWFKLLKNENKKMKGQKEKKYPILVNNQSKGKQKTKLRRVFSDISNKNGVCNFDIVKQRVKQSNAQCLEVLGNKLQEKVLKLQKLKNQKSKRKQQYFQKKLPKSYSLYQRQCSHTPTQRQNSIQPKLKSRVKTNTPKQSFISVSPWQGQVEETVRDLIF